MIDESLNATEQLQAKMAQVRKNAFIHAKLSVSCIEKMTTCIEREGTKSCSWWWNKTCNNPAVTQDIKKQCGGNLLRK